MKRIRQYCITIIFLLLCHAGVVGSVIPLGETEFSFLYDFQYRYHLLERTSLPFQNGPYDRKMFDPDEMHYALFRPLPENQLRFFALVRESAVITEKHRTVANESILGGLLYIPHPNWSVYTGYSLDEAKAKDKTYTGKKWRGLAGGINDAFVSYQSKKLDIYAGRFAQFWGIRNSLIFSEMISLDGLAMSYRFRSLSISYRLAQLNKISNEVNPSLLENRYIAAHRLDWRINEYIRIGAFEAMLFGGVGRSVELNYLNPLIFFHADQLNDDINDNSYLGFDFTLIPGNGVHLYGQLLVDDFQIEQSSQGDEEPNQYAIMVGAEWFNVVNQTDIGFSYSKVTNRTFNQKELRNRFLFNNDPINSVAGNDYDQLNISVTRWFKSYLRARLVWMHTRQGEGRITDEWSEPWLEVDGEYTEPFPTGVVETTNRFSAGITGIIANRWYIDFTLNHSSVDNSNHIENQDTSGWQLKLDISTHLTLDVIP